MIYICNYNSPIGEITAASNGTDLTALCFDGQKYFDDNLQKEHETKDLPIFEQTKKWLDIYFTGKAPDFTPSISLNDMSPFRKRVCEIMLEIPFGKTISYGTIAKQIENETGKRVSAQAVGGAVGHNPIAIIIPCHRVVGTNGNLTGYAGGLDKKTALLQIEGTDMTNLFLPKK